MTKLSKRTCSIEVCIFSLYNKAATPAARSGLPVPCFLYPQADHQEKNTGTV